MQVLMNTGLRAGATIVTMARFDLELDDLRAAPSLDSLRGLPGGLHELKGNRAGQLALDLKGGDRLIIEPAHEPPPTKPDGGLDWKQVTAVRVVEVVDYHD